MSSLLLAHEASMCINTWNSRMYHLIFTSNNWNFVLEEKFIVSLCYIYIRRVEVVDWRFAFVWFQGVLWFMVYFSPLAVSWLMYWLDYCSLIWVILWHKKHFVEFLFSFKFFGICGRIIAFLMVKHSVIRLTGMNLRSLFFFIVTFIYNSNFY